MRIRGALNRLVKTTEGTKVSEYFYDNAGNRFIKKDADGTTVYLRHGQIAVAMDIEVNAVQTTDKGKINRYVLSGDLLAGRVTVTVKADNSKVTAKSWYHLDHLNSTKVVTSATATVEVRYVYRAFGEQLKRLDASGAPTDDKAKFSYGGKELDDETNLYYFNARYYDATTGRFINVDPVQDGSNWYVYCRNNPLKLIDPTGLADIMMQLGQYVIQSKPHELPLKCQNDYFNYQLYKNSAYIATQVSLNKNLEAALFAKASSQTALISNMAQALPCPGNDQAAAAISFIANEFGYNSGDSWEKSARAAIDADKLNNAAQALYDKAFITVNKYLTKINDQIVDLQNNSNLNAEDKKRLGLMEKYANGVAEILRGGDKNAEKMFNLAGFIENPQDFEKPTYNPFMTPQETRKEKNNK
jgi:RHS repeat-associated protein